MTRKEKAKELMRLLGCGPHLSLSIFGLAGERPLTKAQEAEINQKIHLWIDTRVEPLVRDLIKEVPWWL